MEAPARLAAARVEEAAVTPERCVEASARMAAALGGGVVIPEQCVEASARVAAELGWGEDDGMKGSAKIELAESGVVTSEGGDGEEPCLNPWT